MQSKLARSLHQEMIRRRYLGYNDYVREDDKYNGQL